MQRVQKIAAQLSAAPVAGKADFSNVELAPPNAIFNTTARFKADKDPRKMNLGVGAYRDANGKPLVLSAVRKAERLLAHDDSLNHEYLSITGDATYVAAAQRLLFGKNSSALAAGRIATCQSLSGTGGLTLGAFAIKKFLGNPTVYFSTPTWGNHGAIMKQVGVPSKTYRYWDAKNRCLDIEGMIDDLNNAAPGSVILLHACAHNPTGVDATPEQWRRIAATMKAKQLFPFFDSAYQGFASGDLEKDAYALRYFIDQGFSMFVSQSFAKNFGLYSERTGTFSVVTPSKERAAACKSQLALVIRAMYSNPPAHGARVVATVLNDPALYKEWTDELLQMSLRIQAMRAELVGELKRLGTPGDWSHITSQIGMFSFTGLTKNQCNALIDNWHCYLLTNGRISMAGINKGNVKHLAAGINDVVRNVRN